MTTQVESARDGIVTPQIEAVARAENVEVQTLLSRIADGSAVVMTREESPVGIGKGLRTKVNVNIGTSSLKIDPDEEVRKSRVAEKYGADTLTDLSMGGDINGIRRMIFDNTTLPITTIPIYQTAAQIGLKNMACEDIIRSIKQQGYLKWQV